MRQFGRQSSSKSGAGSGSFDDARVRTEATHASTSRHSSSSDNRDENSEGSLKSDTEVAAHDAKRRKTTLGAAKMVFGANIETIHIDTCRLSNAKIKDLKPLVGVFVGATGGIGETTIRELFKRGTAPKVYIIGRNKDKAADLIKELQSINPAGQAIFLEVDCSRLKNVDKACADLIQREQKINCLFLTSGYMSTSGRNETEEGLDRKMSVNYYSRIRWALNLMPCLTAAAKAGELSRVNTVLAAGSESDIRLDDLDLRQGFTLHACLAHCSVMSDFMVEELAKKFPQTSFSHSYPGTVKTGIANELNGPARLAVKVLYTLMTPWIINVQESGERHLFQMTSKCYPPKQGGTGVDIPQGLSEMRGSNGEVASGGYLLDWDGKPTGDEKILTKYRTIGFGKIAWDHTMQMFQQAEQRQKAAVERHAARVSNEESRAGPADPIGWRPA